MSRIRTVSLACLALAGIVFVGCGRGGPSRPSVVQLGPSPSAQEAKAFAESFSAALSSGSADAANNLVDWNTLLEVVTSGLDISEEFRKGFLTGANKSCRSEAGICQTLIANVKQGGKVKLLRIHEIDGRQRAFFRQIQSEGGVGYIDFVLARSPDGKVRAIDIEPLQQGEPISKTIRSIYVQAAAGQGGGFLERLTSKESDMAKAAPLISAVASQVRNKQFPEAMATFKKMPPSVQKQKPLMLMKYMIGQGLGDDQYIEAIREFRELFPNDPSVELLSIDYYLLKEQYDESEQCVDRLDKVVNDPYLDVLRAQINCKAEKYQVAHAAADRVMRNEPDLEYAFWAGVTVSLGEKRFAETLRLLKLLKSRFHVQMQDLHTVPAYAEFVKAPEFAQWQKVLAGK